MSKNYIGLSSVLSKAMIFTYIVFLSYQFLETQVAISKLKMRHYDMKCKSKNAQMRDHELNRVQ